MVAEKVEHGRTDIKLYTFLHNDGTTITCTKNELIRKFNLSRSCINAMLRGASGYNSVKGWKIIR